MHESVKEILARFKNNLPNYVVDSMQLLKFKFGANPFLLSRPVFFFFFNVFLFLFTSFQSFV